FVALKLLQAGINPNKARRFQQEAKLAGKIKHANVVNILDFGLTKANAPYMVMEMVEGKSLGQMIAAQGCLSIEEALPIFDQIIAALRCAHKEKVLHRDLKPDNVLVSSTMEYEPNVPLVKITDFGLAKVFDSPQDLTP